MGDRLKPDHSFGRAKSREVEGVVADIGPDVEVGAAAPQRTDSLKQRLLVEPPLVDAVIGA